MNNELIEKVDRALDAIRPYLAADGGNVKVVDVTKDNKVKVQLLGACDNCPMSSMTMKAGIEDAIKKAVPQIVAVESV